MDRSRDWRARETVAYDRATTNHTSRTGTYHDTGTDQEGPVNDVAANFKASQDVGNDDSGTADGNDTASGAAGHFDAKAGDDGRRAQRTRK